MLLISSKMRIYHVRNLIEAIIQNPILMERPIVLANNKAAIGRPPESVLKII